MGNAKLTGVSVKLPGGIIEGTWMADESQQKAAWEMYVELVTRISIQKLPGDEGLIREALSSLHALFGETRRILREYGPAIAKPEKKKFISFGALAVDVLNVWLRPFLAKWHPLLGDHESRRPAGVSAYQHELAWDKSRALRAELVELQHKLVAYADLLAEACNIPSLHARAEG